MTGPTLRRLLAVVAGVLLAVGFALGLARPAAAAAQDQIDSFTASYAVQTSGVVAVKERIVYRFGDNNSARHGIQRQLITREKYDDDQDALYTYSNIAVSSPSGAPDGYTTIDESDNGGRSQSIVLRIGDPNQKVAAPTAIYDISYDVAGAMRNSPGYDEFSWDVTGFIGTPQTNDVTVSVSVPGGVLNGDAGALCFAGPAGRSSTDPCTSSSVSAGVARFTQNSLAPANGLTVATKIKPGLLAVNAPNLQPSASALTPAQKTALVGGGIAGGAVVVGSPIAGLLWWRRKGRDRRYVGLPPGTVPYAGQTAEIGYHDKSIEIPVAFSPPHIPVAEAGLLVDGQVDTRETAATIIDLAVRGVLTVQGQDKDDYQVTLVDPSRTTAPHESVLLTKLFGGRPPGAVAELSSRGSIVTAHQALVEAVRSQVRARGWFTSVPATKSSTGFGLGGIAIVAFVLFQVGHSLWWLALLLAPIVITIAVIRYKLKNGQRTADGRAVCDQVEGFKLYLETAEADQLRFEEGEDIFSRYLPWAIAFDLADRWAKVCSDLVAAGRLPDTTPYWYVGNYYAFNMGLFASSLTSSLTTAATPVPPSGGSGSGTGFGGGSSFGGGGFAGGGGGGGGTSGW
ncbi:MAG: DUF2207 domain-containing protein [Propionibacteriaceae bacterium]